MEIKKFDISDVILFKPKVFRDDRGYFFEAFNKRVFDEVVGEEYNFVQDNQSQSQKGTIRGLHFQKPPFAQGKLVSVVKGKVIDFLVDIRKQSPTYGKDLQVVLTENEHAFLWIPPGFAHGFYTLEDHTIFQYKCTNYYHKDSEGDLKWSDSAFSFSKLADNPTVSDKDQVAESFTNFKSPF